MWTPLCIHSCKVMMMVIMTMLALMPWAWFHMVPPKSLHSVCSQFLHSYLILMSHYINCRNCKDPVSSACLCSPQLWLSTIQTSPWVAWVCGCASVSEWQGNVLSKQQVVDSCFVAWLEYSLCVLQYLYLSVIWLRSENNFLTPLVTRVVCFFIRV